MTEKEGKGSKDEKARLGKDDVLISTNNTLVEELAKKIAELTESERRHRMLLDDLHDVVVRLSASGAVIYVNDAWRSRFGLDPGQSVGKKFVSWLHAEDHEKFARLIDPKAEQDDMDRILRITDHKGEFHLVETRLHRNEGDEIVGILEDVTLRQQLETERVRTQRLESIGRLAGGLAHDFNNLLSVVLGNIELAQSRLEPDSEGSRELEYASRACMQATEIAKQMLVFSKGGVPKRRPECMEKIVREAFDLYLRGSGVTGEVEVEPGIGLVQVDASQMHQVLNNLILNAIDAMSDGGRLWGTVKNAVMGNGKPGLMVVIRDEGEGIPPEKIDQIFEPYFTTKDAGNGLGLTSTYGIVKRHGGELDVDSKVDVGTEFRITLETVDDEIEGSELPTSSSPRKRAAKVLVMDDDEMVRGVMVAMLESLGHEVVQSRHGEECVTAFSTARDSNEPFDLVVLDLTIIGGRDGIWTIGRLREMEPKVKALVATGYNNAPVVADPKAHGFVGSVSKPTTLEDLESRILDALSGGG